MLKFGTSAYLKLISLNERPQRTELKKRFAPKHEGYDFHRSLRRHAHRLVVRGENAQSIRSSIEQISRKPERESAKAGLKALSTWRDKNPAVIFDIEKYTYRSPNDIFSVDFEPDFGLTLEGRAWAVHLWNTKKPPLNERLTIATLSLLWGGFPTLDGISVLALENQRLIASNKDSAYAVLGRNVTLRLEATILELEEELKHKKKEDHPPRDMPPHPRP